VCAETVSPRRAVPRLRDLLRCSSGAAAVEFAFVFPLLITLVLGIYSVGAVMHSISSVRYALEETGRMLQMDHSLTEDDLQTVLNEKLDYLGKQEVTLDVTLEKDAYGSDIARLTATYPYTIAVPFIPRYEGAYQQTAQVFLVINP
jgi:Flp pilus assembly protein TadG